MDSAGTDPRLQVTGAGRIIASDGPARLAEPADVLPVALGGAQVGRCHERAMRGIPSATLFGVSSQGDFRVDVTDAKHNDTWRLRLASGYDSGEARLRSGNLKVKP